MEEVWLPSAILSDKSVPAHDRETSMSTAPVCQSCETAMLTEDQLPLLLNGSGVVRLGR